MKTIFSTIALFSAVLFATSCTEDMEYKDSKVSSVNQLYEPTDGKEVVLQSSASASLFFEMGVCPRLKIAVPLFMKWYSIKKVEIFLSLFTKCFLTMAVL